MSKSLGNFVTINELLNTETFGGRKWPGEVLRLTMLKTHYRQPIDWTVSGLHEAERQLVRWRRYLIGSGIDLSTTPNAKFPHLLDALCDDLNTVDLIARMHALTRVGPNLLGLTDEEASAGSPDDIRLAALQLLWSLEVVGLRNILSSNWGQVSVEAETLRKVEMFIGARLDARKAKNWAESDRIRDELAAMGIAIKDNKDGTTTWEVKR
jgi:cysteinyl-tRNA synthetase